MDHYEWILGKDIVNKFIKKLIDKIYKIYYNKPVSNNEMIH